MSNYDVEVKMFFRFLKEMNLHKEINKNSIGVFKSYDSVNWVRIVEYKSNVIGGKFWSDTYIKWIVILFDYYLTNYGKENIPFFIKESIVKSHFTLNKDGYKKYAKIRTFNALNRVVKSYNKK